MEQRSDGGGRGPTAIPVRSSTIRVSSREPLFDSILQDLGSNFGPLLRLDMLAAANVLFGVRSRTKVVEPCPSERKSGPLIDIKVGVQIDRRSSHCATPNGVGVFFESDAPVNLTPPKPKGSRTLTS